MKKHLLAVAVATTVAAPVMAQNMEIYGIVGISQGAATSGGDNNRSVMTGNGAMSSSRFGLRGTEDLGGGMKAALKLEASLGGDSGGLGAAGSNATNTAAPIFDRDAYLSLSSGFGEVRLGRQENPVNAFIAATNVTGSNVGGAGFGGSSNNAYACPTQNAASNSNAQGTGVQAICSRLSNTIQYISPAFSGAQVLLGYVNGEATAINATAAGTGSGNTQQLGFLYNAGPLTVRAAWQEMKLNAQGTSKANESIVGATYDAGFARFGVSLVDVDPNTANTADKRKAYSYTANAPLGSGLSAFVSYMMLEEGATANGGFGTSTTLDHKATAVVAGVKKDLSKRTFGFAMYGRVDNNDAANYTLHSSSGMPSGTVAKDGKTVLVGVQHSF